jgi:hypothetical protein
MSRPVRAYVLWAKVLREARGGFRTSTYRHFTTPPGVARIAPRHIDHPTWHEVRYIDVAHVVLLADASRRYIPSRPLVCCCRPLTHLQPGAQCDRAPWRSWCVLHVDRARIAENDRRVLHEASVVSHHEYGAPLDVASPNHEARHGRRNGHPPPYAGARRTHCARTHAGHYLAWKARPHTLQYQPDPIRSIIRVSPQ